MPTIGSILQKTRVQQERTLQEVSSALHIKTEYLEALEQDAYERIPGAVFAKGFIRNYGNYLGLDGTGLVQAYKTSYEQWRPQPEIRPVAVKKKKTAKSRRVKKRKGKWPEITIIAGVIIFLLLMVWLVW